MKILLSAAFALALASPALAQRTPSPDPGPPPEVTNGLGPRNAPPTPGQPIERIGRNGVSAPIVLFAPEPEFSKEARKDKISGRVLIYLQVSPDGLPDHVRVLRGVGYGLDEKAMEAVRSYRFKPAMKDGAPVRVEMNVEVNFQVYDRKPS